MSKRISAVSDLAVLKWAKMEAEGVNLENRLKAYNAANELLRGDGFGDEERQIILENAGDRYRALVRGQVLAISPEVARSLGLV